MFQSLSGFRVRCNIRAWPCHDSPDGHVSIPIGFSSTLQRSNRQLGRQQHDRFNPYRVFEYVATLGGTIIHLPSRGFQSLSGFRVRCNKLEDTKMRCRLCVSIPIGFSSTLQQHPFFGPIYSPCCFNPYRVFEYVATLISIQVIVIAYQFQSLSGFRVRCNRRIGLLIWICSFCFNPYRVFEYVATIISPGSKAKPPVCFNPYRVFEYVATPKSAATSSPGGFVSIPIGFSSTLQQGPPRPSRSPAMCFNPYRVFEYVATMRVRRWHT